MEEYEPETRAHVLELHVWNTRAEVPGKLSAPINSGGCQPIWICSPLDALHTSLSHGIYSETTRNMLNLCHTCVCARGMLSSRIEVPFVLGWIIKCCSVCFQVDSRWAKHLNIGGLRRTAKAIRQTGCALKTQMKLAGRRIFLGGNEECKFGRIVIWWIRLVGCNLNSFLNSKSKPFLYSRKFF